MKVLVIFADGFEEVEALAPVDTLRRAGASVVMAALKKNKELTAEGSHGITVKCDAALENVNCDEFDAVVIPGGLRGAKNLAASSLVGECLKSTDRRGALVCAICASPALVLYPLGILDGRKAVCYPGMEIENSRAQFLTDRVCRDKNIITSRGAGCAMEFALEIVKALFGEEKALSLHDGMVC